uniref:IS3 family transposase n=1 Tax=Corynebacterium casei TaxID=160386 RepID=UPI00117777A7
MNREGHLGHVARCTVERLMAAEGLRGIRRRKKNVATKYLAVTEETFYTQCRCRCLPRGSGGS